VLIILVTQEAEIRRIRVPSQILANISEDLILKKNNHHSHTHKKGGWWIV
jgi:hypothetical protein